MWIRPPRRAMWVFPILIGILVVTFSALGVSGSSTSLLGSEGGRDGVVAGSPRAVRSDEWLVRTPMVVGQVGRGFSRFAEIGVGQHDMAVLSDLPVKSWTALFHPQNSLFFVMPVENAFAFEWWSTGALVLLGAYALFLVLLRDWRWSVIGALVLWGSPFFHWWHYPAMAAIASWALLATASFLSSLNPKLRGWHRWWRVGVTAYFGACFALILYPPAQIPVIFVALAVIVGWVIPKLRSRTIHWRALALHLVAAGVALGAVILVFVVTHSQALTAISQSVYPGERRLPGGGGSAGLLFDAWYGWSFISNDAGMRPAILNESEASSFLFLGLFAISGLFLIWRFGIRQNIEHRGVTLGLLAVVFMLLVHIFIGWGPLITKVTLLDRVSPGRAILGLGIASTILLIFIGKIVADAEIPPRWSRLATASTVAVGGAGILWLGSQWRREGLPIDRSTIAIVLFVFLVPSALLFWKPFLALIALAVIGIAFSVPANPLTHGLGPLVSSDLVREVKTLNEANPGGGWLGSDSYVSSVLTAAGTDSLSAVNLYPNVDAWRILDPASDSEFVWNRYAHVFWVFDDSMKDPIFTLLQHDVFQVRIAPCDQRLVALGVTNFVSTAALNSSCLRPVSGVMGPLGVPVTIYAMVPSSPR